MGSVRYATPNLKSYFVAIIGPAAVSSSSPRTPAFCYRRELLESRHSIVLFVVVSFPTVFRLPRQHESLSLSLLVKRIHSRPRSLLGFSTQAMELHSHHPPRLMTEFCHVVGIDYEDDLANHSSFHYRNYATLIALVVDVGDEENTAQTSAQATDVEYESDASKPPYLLTFHYLFSTVTPIINHWI